MCRKPLLTISPSELISPCSSALVATVVPWARPTTLSADAPQAARILLTPRSKPTAGFDGDRHDIGECSAGIDANAKTRRRRTGHARTIFRDLRMPGCA